MENALLEDAPTLVQEARIWQANGWMNEDGASATLTARSLDDIELGSTEVKPDHVLKRAAAEDWVRGGYLRLATD